MSAQVRRRLARFFNSGNGKHGFQAQFRLRRAFGSVTGISQTKHLRSGSPFARKTATQAFISSRRASRIRIGRRPSHTRPLVIS
jgi:hypothetical protein